MATALYRRYRPEAFAEMIGQAHVTEPLMTALRTERIGHAYLFSGPRGCGKTTSARILARCLNCAEGPTDQPCGTCPSCVELSRDGGGSLDVVEIDAASHGGVDDARDLRERAVFAPARDRYKIFIIDEAHMVTAGGFNALLKIVEEPPPHVKFIFATTEPEKVIGTIRSRTHHYPFRLIAPGTLIDYVQQLCDSEGVAIEPGVLPLVVRAGGGSVRDTLSILDQLIAGSEDNSVTLERATGLLGFTSAELIDEVVLALGSGDPAKAFAATDRVVQTGQDPRRFVEDLLERLRDLIVISATTVQGASAVFRGVPEDQLQRMFEQSQTFAPGQLSSIADTVSGALDTMTGATAPRLHLELMVARALLVHGATGTSDSAAPRSVASAPAPQQAALATQHPTKQQASQAPSAADQVPTPDSSPAAATTGAPTTSRPAAASVSTHAAAAPAVDVIAAMKSAREFLNSDSAGASRPPIVPLGGPAPQQAAAQSTATQSTSEQPSPPPSSSADSPEPQAAAPEAASLSLQDLTDVWQDLLEELLESDREAWNAVKVVQPLELRGDTLLVGMESESDLAAFKAAGAAPLREAIVGALGVSIKYLPRPMPAGVRPIDSSSAERESSEPAPQEPSPTRPTEAEGLEVGDAAQAVADLITPEPAYDAEPPPSNSEPGPAEPKLAEPEPQEPEPAEPDPVEPEFAPDPEPAWEPQREPADEQAAASSVTEVAAKPQVKTEAPTPKKEPLGFTRYGESVVREVLGARFIEERPLPEGFEH